MTEQSDEWRQSLDFILLRSGLPARDLWEAAYGVLEELEMADVCYDVPQHEGVLVHGRVREALADVKFFHVDGERARVRRLPGKAREDILRLTFREGTELCSDSIGRCVAALEASSGVCYARLFDSVWEKWENEEVIGKFHSTGRSVKGLRRKRDPYFDEDVIDTSYNSGRLVARNGYTERLGHQMWFTSAFWELTGADRSAVCEQAIGCVAVDGLTAVKFSAVPFGKRNPVPDALRRSLFP